MRRRPPTPPLFPSTPLFRSPPPPLALARLTEKAQPAPPCSNPPSITRFFLSAAPASDWNASKITAGDRINPRTKGCFIVVMLHRSSRYEEAPSFLDTVTVELWTVCGLAHYRVLFVLKLGTRAVEIAGIAPEPSQSMACNLT